MYYIRYTNPGKSQRKRVETAAQYTNREEAEKAKEFLKSQGAKRASVHYIED